MPQQLRFADFNLQVFFCCPEKEQKVERSVQRSNRKVPLNFKPTFYIVDLKIQEDTIMSKIYFVMNNRENISEGYKEVSEEEFGNYIGSFPEGKRAYFINLGYAVLETNEENYCDYYKDVNRNDYLKKLDAKNGLMSYSALDTDEFDGSNIVEDTSEAFEDRVLCKLMIEKLPEALSKLKKEERTMILEIYFNGMSERDLEEVYRISNIAIHKRKNKNLKKLQKFFQE